MYFGRTLRFTAPFLQLCLSLQIRRLSPFRPQITVCLLHITNSEEQKQIDQNIFRACQRQQTSCPVQARVPSHSRDCMDAPMISGLLLCPLMHLSLEPPPCPQHLLLVFDVKMVYDINLPAVPVLREFLTAA